MIDAPVWERDGRDWPNRSASRFVEAGGLRWHVQRLGSGPPLLLVHGTGASTHSYAALAPRLAQHFDVFSFDLPGHGFTERPPFERLSLPGMAAAIQELLRVERVTPELVVGHSAGAAILVHLCLERALAPRRLVSLNGSLLPLGGTRNPALAPLTRLAICNSLTPRLVAWRAADGSAMTKLLEDTGSDLRLIGLEYYLRLARFPRHVGAALGMMANWDVRPLARAMPTLATPLTLVAAENDRMIPAECAEDVRKLVPAAEVVPLDGLGHLAHEENPALVADLILARAH
jgi:magnesium chelatase accessory protein